MGSLLALEACGPELREQFEFALGEDFSVRSLINSLKERSLFHEARGTLNSFITDVETRHAMTLTHDTAYFASRCEMDDDSTSETAEFSVDRNDLDSEYDKYVEVTISPNALRALYKPMASIVETVSPGNELLVPKNELANLVYRAVYAKTIAQYVVMQHMLPALKDQSAMSKFEVMTDYFYPKKFGDDGIGDFVVRADRLAMAFSGSVMYRQAAVNLDHEVGRKTDTQTQQIGQLIKMYAAGLANVRPVDQQRVTFPLVHAFTPKEASGFLKAWFS